LIQKPTGVREELTQRAIDLRRMTEKEYANYMEAHLEAYAQVRARAFKSSKDEELAVAKKQVRGLLTDGLKTKGHFIYVAVDSATGESVGNLWVHVEPDKKRAFLYDIIVHERFRRQGYGRSMLNLLELKMRQMHVSILGLHVFAENEVAFNLYSKVGYVVASYNMQKNL